MGRADPDDLLRLSDAAALLGVGDTTLKRWTEENRIPCERTLGGHRRFRRSAVLAWKAAHSGASTGAPAPGQDAPAPVAASTDARTWLDAESDPAEPTRVHAHLVTLRSRCRDWAETGDRLCSGLLSEIGSRWMSGTLTCAQEHAMTRSIEIGISRISHQFPIAPNAPCVVLACPAGERHTLGLTLVEAVLRERGVQVHFLGPDVPSRDLVDAVRRIGPIAVGLSASSCPRPSIELEEAASAAAAVCAEKRARLLLGGGAAWPPTKGARRFLTLTELARAIDELVPKSFAS